MSPDNKQKLKVLPEEKQLPENQINNIVPQLITNIVTEVANISGFQHSEDPLKKGFLQGHGQEVVFYHSGEISTAYKKDERIEHFTLTKTDRNGWKIVSIHISRDPQQEKVKNAKVAFEQEGGYQFINTQQALDCSIKFIHSL